MACDVNAVIAALQASGLCSETDPIKLQQLTAQALANRLVTLYPGTNVTPEAVLARACLSGIGKIQDPMLLQKAFAQNVCNGFPIPVPPDPYDGILYYTRTGLPPVTVVNPTGAFVLTNASNPVIEIHCHNCPNITSLTCQNSAVLVVVDLVNVINLDTLNFNNSDALVTLDLSLMNNPVLGNLTFGASLLLATINMTGVVTTGALDISFDPALVTLMVPNLATTGNLNFGVCGFVNLTFPALTTVTGFVSGNQCNSLVTLSFPELLTVASSFFGESCPLLQTLNTPKITSCSVWYSRICNSLLAWNAPALVSCPQINCNNNPAMTTIGPSNNGKFINLTAANFSGCALNQASVDLVLQQGVNTPMTGGTITMNGGTSSAPSATGLANKATLTTAGVGVTTN